MLLVTGGTGQLGTTLRALLPEAVFTGSRDLDIRDADAVQTFVKRSGIDVIVNCAAYTAVDRAEDEPERAEQINADGVANLAKTGAALLHISTDYVFDGMAEAPYTEECPANPLSVYGRTKLLGEEEALRHAPVAVVLRTGWLYSPHRANFLKTMLRLGRERETLGVVADQRGTPTSCLDLARAIVRILPQLRESVRGVYHYSNAGECSWFDFASEIMRGAGLPCRVTPLVTKDYPVRAARPRYSVLDKRKIIAAFGVVTPPWNESLRQCLKQFSSPAAPDSLVPTSSPTFARNTSTMPSSPSTN